MKLNYALILSTLLIALSSTAIAKNETSDLAMPIATLMKHFTAIRSGLGLSDKQNIIIDNWIENAPARRKELEKEATALRKELRVAIINGESRLKRENIKKKLSDSNIRLIEANSLCVRMLQNTLTEDQYAAVIKRYVMETQSTQ